MMADIKVYDIEKDELNFDFDYHPIETNSLHKLLNNKSNISINDIRRVALWKLSRVIDIPDSVLEMLGQLALIKNLKIRDELSLSAISELIKCDGVGFPIASTILKFLRPDVYPIIDIRAYRVLTGRQLNSSSYHLELYLGYVDQIRKISETKGIPLNQVDEQLYEFDKKHNGNINNPGKPSTL